MTEHLCSDCPHNDSASVIGRDQIDLEYKKRYHRFPSAAERAQYKKNRPGKIFLTADEIAAIKKPPSKWFRSSNTINPAYRKK